MIHTLVPELAPYEYDALGQRTKLTRPNGVISNWRWDDASRMDRLLTDWPGTANDLTLTFTFNPAGQIATRVASNDAYAHSYANQSTSYAINGRNQATSAGGATLTYDATANLTGDGARTWGYDDQNRMDAASGGTTMSYDAAGRLYRVAQSSGGDTRFLYDGVNPIAEYDASGVVIRRFVQGPGADEQLVWWAGAGLGNRRWLIPDERGSIVGVSNDTGGAVQLNTYDDYGQPGSSNLGRFQYTGQMWINEAGVYSYKARTYHPGLGRFMQTDPIGYAGGLNLYAYVRNDPVNFVDPSGLRLVCQDVFGGPPGTTQYAVCRKIDDDFGLGGVGGYTGSSGSLRGDGPDRERDRPQRPAAPQSCADARFKQQQAQQNFDQSTAIQRAAILPTVLSFLAAGSVGASQLAGPHAAAQVGKATNAAKGLATRAGLLSGPGLFIQAVIEATAASEMLVDRSAALSQANADVNNLCYRGN